MRKWILACAVLTVACIFVEPVSAQGILGRLGIRRPMATTVSEPAIATTQTPTTQPRTIVQPSTTTTTPMATTQMPVEQRRGILSRLRPGRQMATTTTAVEPIQAPAKAMPSTGVVQAQGTTTTTPMATTSTMPVSEGRQGIFTRLRSRIGR